MDQIEREVIQHGYDIKSLKESLLRMDADRMDIRKDLEKLEDSHYAVRDAVREMVTASKATREQAEKIANDTITSKQLYVSVGLLLVTLVGLALGVAFK